MPLTSIIINQEIKMKCPYCNKCKCEPSAVYKNCEIYGSGRFNFKCIHCKNVVSVYAERRVVYGKPTKTDSESDWG
jgi:hypothetical protein